MSKLNRRTQILFDDERYKRLSERAAEQGTSVAELIRRAVDEVYPTVSEQRSRAAQSFLDAEPASFAPIDVGELRQELDSRYDRLLELTQVQEQPLVSEEKDARTDDGR